MKIETFHYNLGYCFHIHLVWEKWWKWIVIDVGKWVIFFILQNKSRKRQE